MDELTAEDIEDIMAKARALPDPVKAILHEATTPARRWCFAVFVHQRTEDGYIPSVVYENEAGHSPLIGSGEFSQPWFWGQTWDQAQQVCEEANAARGVSPDEAKEIVDSSIMVSIRETSNHAAGEAKLRQLGLRP